MQEKLSLYHSHDSYILNIWLQLIRITVEKKLGSELVLIFMKVLCILWDWNFE